MVVGEGKGGGGGVVVEIKLTLKIDSTATLQPASPSVLVISTSDCSLKVIHIIDIISVRCDVGLNHLEEISKCDNSD